MISIDSLEFSYGKNPVIKGINKDFSSGMVHGILGTNGAGKTTLFKLIYRIEIPLSGTIKWRDEQLSKRNCFFLETLNYYYPYITGKEYLDLFPSSDGSIQEVDLQELFHLPLKELIENYSTGMKKKLAIMAMLKSDREVLLMDEPFNGLDLESSRILVLLMEKLRKLGKTILVSSHILETLTNTCDQIHILESGVIWKTIEKSNFEILEKEFFKDFDEKIRGKLGD